MNSLKVRSLNWAWGSWSTNIFLPPRRGLFEQSQIDLGNLLCDFPTFLKSLQALGQLRENLFRKIMHLGFPRSRDREIMSGVLGVPWFGAMAVLISASVVQMHQASLDHVTRQREEFFLKQPLAVFEVNDLLYHKSYIIIRKAHLSSSIARFFEVLTYSRAIGGGF